MFALINFIGILLLIFSLGAALYRMVHHRLKLEMNSHRSPVGMILGAAMIYIIHLITLNIHHTMIALIVLGGVSAIFLFYWKLLSWKLFFKLTGLAFVLYLITGFLPLGVWDPRSIWSFQGETIFYLKGSEWLQFLSEPSLEFSHTDYPKLYPILSALLSSTLGEWREQFAKTSLVYLWLPIFWTVLNLNKRARYTGLFLLLFLGRHQMTVGMVDFLLAGFMMAGFLAYMDDRNKLVDALILVSAPIMIKAEGLVLTLFGVSLLAIWNWSENRKPVFIVLKLPLFAALYWKYLAGTHQIKNYLTSDLGEAKVRFLSRVFELKNYGTFLDSLSYYNKPITIMVYIALVRRMIIGGKLKAAEKCALTFSVGYLGFLLCTYLATPFDFDWHVKMSIERTALPVLLVMLAVLIIPDNGSATKL